MFVVVCLDGMEDKMIMGWIRRGGLDEWASLAPPIRSRERRLVWLTTMDHSIFNAREQVSTTHRSLPNESATTESRQLPYRGCTTWPWSLEWPDHLRTVRVVASARKHANF
jgi:hypothetical protein